MANIKCTYYRYRCNDGTYEHNGRICDHHDYGWAGDEYDSCCDYADDKPYKAENGMYAIPLQCRYVYEEEVMFEKAVRQYELDDDSLTMPRKEIPLHRIKYLCIDGKEIISDSNG